MDNQFLEGNIVSIKRNHIVLKLNNEEQKIDKDRIKCVYFGSPKIISLIKKKNIIEDKIMLFNKSPGLGFWKNREAGIFLMILVPGLGSCYYIGLPLLYPIFEPMKTISILNGLALAACHGISIYYFSINNQGMGWLGVGGAVTIGILETILYGKCIKKAQIKLIEYENEIQKIEQSLKEYSIKPRKQNIYLGYSFRF